MIWTGFALSLLGVILLTIVGLIWTDLANWVFTIGAVRCRSEKYVYTLVKTDTETKIKTSQY